ncbi:hypothetical protein NOCARDAX2BIS_310004 [Nocardioides sp. AX2bis]|nr:hypothetical protein NOCARDAX2BIS_310004 [Nocardioides sp. AX2bis]
MPRSVAGWPAWANSQSSTAAISRLVGSTSTFFGLRSLWTRLRRRTSESTSSAQPASSSSPSSSDGPHPSARCRSSRRAARTPPTSTWSPYDPIRRSPSRNGPVLGCGMHASSPATRPRPRPRRASASSSSRIPSSARSPRTPGTNEVTSRPGEPDTGSARRTSSTSGTGSSPRTSASTAASTSGAAGPRASERPPYTRTTVRSAPTPARKVSPDQPPLRGSRVGCTSSMVPAPCDRPPVPHEVLPLGSGGGRARVPTARPGRGRAARRRRGRVPPGQRPRLGPLRRRVPGHPRRLPRRRRLRVGPRGADRGRGRRAR